MKLFSKKALALVLTLAMLVSCMVFSFSADADMSACARNTYDNADTGAWKTAFDGNASAHSDSTKAYADYYDDEGNGTMKIGFGSGGEGKLAGYWFYSNGGNWHNDNGNWSSYGNGKYMVTLKYKVLSLASNSTYAANAQVAIRFGMAHRDYWYYTKDADKSISNFESAKGSANSVVAVVDASDVGAGWQTAVGYLEVTGADGLTNKGGAHKPHILATLGGGYQDALGNTEILIDDVYIYQYDTIEDVTTPDPRLVSTKLWENDFSNPTSYNWAMYTREYNTNSNATWYTNFYTDTRSTTGNYADLEDGYIKMGFSAAGADSYISAFTLKHRSTVTGSSLAYGTSGTNATTNRDGRFTPAAGTYAIKFDYRVKSFNAAAGSSMNLNLARSKGSGIDGNRPTSVFGGYDKIMTVDADDVSTEWQTKVFFVTLPDGIATGSLGGLFMFANMSSTSADPTDCEIQVDNFEIYSYTTLPKLSVKYNGTEVGSVDGLPSYPVDLPAADALTMSVPDGYAVQYYTDEACTAPVTGPVICGNTGNTVYAGLVMIPKQAIWENHFDNGTDTNWKANYKGKGDDGASNSGQVGLGSNENYAVLETHDDNTHMTLGFNNDGSTGCLSGFWMYHEGTTTTTAGQPGYAGAGYSPDAAAREKGNFRPSIGTYIVKIRYKVANFVDNSKASMDIAVGLGAKWAFYWDTNKSRKDLAVIETLATVTNADESDEWKTAMVAISVPQAEMSLHIFATYTPGHQSNLTGSEVYIDDVQIYTNTIALDQTVNDRTAYLYRGNAGTEEEPIWTNLHSYVGNTEKEGVFTSLRLAAKYTAGDSTGSTIIIDGMEYELLERGIVVGVADGTLDAFNYKWKSSKTTNFDQYWAPDPAVSSDEPTEITFTLRLANMGEAWFTNDTAYQFRSYYKVKDLAIDDETGFYVYGGISEAKTFGQMADTFEKDFWFPSLTTNS